MELNAEGNQINEDFRAGFVAVMGRPNVGKSTLMNTLLGQKVAAVSPRPQTTRRRQLGILTLNKLQAIFIDTPGIHIARYKLGAIMNETAAEALEESDLILFVVDASEKPGEEDQILAGLLRKIKVTVPVILVLNKADLLNADAIAERSEQYLELAPGAFAIPVSAASGDNIPFLLEEIAARLPKNEPFYPEDQITDFYEREIAADLIREAALIELRDEIPHGISVRIDEFTERPDGSAYIAATIFVERESHKGIVIGQGGSMLKTIGSAARQEIERMNERKVFLQIRVKIRKNWRNDPSSLKHFGFKSSKG